MSFLPGAASLGTAAGSIRIDTSSLERVRAISRKVGEDVSRSLGRAGTGAERFSRQIRELRGELLALSATGGLITGIGLRGARDVKNFRTAFRLLLGDQEEAVELMEELTGSANEFGIEVTEVWQLARALLPVLEGGADALDDWVKRAALLASTNPLKGTADAARAIQEFLAGQTVSLQRLFNVDPNLIRQATEQFEDVGDQLDFILERMGATEEGAREMADAMVGVRNELQLVLATGFRPLSQAMQPVLVAFRDWLSELRQTRPELLGIAGNLVAVTTAAAGTAVVMGQLVDLAAKLKGLGILAAAGRGGLIGLAAVAAGTAAVAGSREVGRRTGNEQLANITAQQATFQIAAQLTQMLSSLDRFMTDAGARFVETIGTMQTAVGRFVAWLGSIIPARLGGEQLSETGESMVAGTADFVEQAIARGFAGFAEREMNRFQTLDAFQNMLFPPGATPGAGSGTGLASAEQQVAADRLQTIQDWAGQVRAIEQQAATARLQATRQFEQQRQQVIEQFELTIAREAEDFARQRARQQQQLQRQIADIRSDAAEREAEGWADLQSRITDVRAESAERIADIEERHARNRERAHRDHRDRLLDAASRLDARAVAEEQRRFQRQTQTMEEELQDRIEQERESLQERIEQEEEAHRERVRQARQADEERIRDLEESLRRQQRIEDEDRRIRLQRMEEDHQRQLRQLERSHQARLQEIVAQEAREKAALNRGFMAQLEELGEHNEAWLKAQERRQEQSLRMFDEWWESINQRFRTPTSGGPTGPPVAEMFQRGGPVDFTGPAMVHGSRRRPEFMLSADTTAMLRDMLGNFSQPDLVNAVAAGGRGGGSVSLSLSDGAIQVFGAPGQSEEAIGEAVRREVLEIMSSLS